MSPALVDSVNRTSTPQMQTQHSFMQNPNPKGQVPSPFLFDFSGFPSEQLGRPSQTDSEPMNSFNVGLGAYSNQNPNVSNFQSGSALPSNSRLGSEKLSFGHTSGLSKPRLLKVRKHLGSQPVRPSPTSGTRVDPGFNPFSQASANLERAEDKSRVQELHDQWCGWKPFSSELGHDGRDSGSSGASTSSDCRFGKSGYENFVFSANKSGSSLESEMIGSRGNVEKSHPENMGKSKFGSEMEFQDAKGAAFGFDASGKGVLNSCEGIDKGAFVFGVSSKKNSKFDGSNISRLPDEMRKLNIFASENGEAVEKTGSCGNVWKSHPEDMGKSKFGSETEFQDAKGAAFCFDASGKGVLNSGEGIDKGAFVFGVSSKKNSKFDGSNVSGLPDEMRKLNIVASEHGEAIEKTKDTYLSTKNSDNNTFFFGINSNVACDCVGSGNGVIVEEAKDTSLRSKASNENILFSRSINNAAGSCSSSGNDNGVENSKDTGDCLKSNNKNNFECGRNVASGFGGSRNIDNVEKTKNPNIISNASDKNNFVFYNNNDIVRDPIGSVNVDNFEKTKDSNLGSKTTYTINFAFGSSKNIATAFGSSESGDDAGNTKNSNLSSVDSDRKNPVIGSNSNLASGFHGSENEDGVEKSEGVNLSSNASNKSNMASDFVGTDSGVWKTKDADLSPKANDKNIFIFGGLNHAGCASATAVSELPHEMKKLNIEDSRKADGAEKQESYTNDKIPFVCSGKKATDFFARCSATTIHDRMKKLNISGSGSGDRIRRGRRPTFKTSDQKFFVFGSSNTTASSSVGTAEDDLRNEIRKFNIGSQMRDSTGQGDISHPPSGIFVVGSSNTAANYSVGTAEDNLPDEIRKLNIGIKTGNSTDQADMGLPTPGISVKEKQPENLGAEPFHDPEVSNSAPKSFAFKTGFHGKGSDEIPPVQPSDGTNPSGDAATSFSFALNDVPFQPFVNVFEVTSMDRAEKKDGFSFPSTQHGSGTPQTDLRMADKDVLFSSTGFVGLNQKLQFSAKRGAAKGSRLKKRRGKLRQPMASQQLDGKDFVSKESNSQEIPESPGCYSPMDFSPYQETLVTDQCSRETSMTSNDSFHLDNSYVSSNVHQAVSTDARDEDLVAAAQRLDIDDGNQECRESKFSFSFKESVSDECPTDEFVSGTEKERSKSTTEQVNVSAFVTSAEPEAGFSSKTVRQESDFKQFSFTSSLEHVGETDFTFAASSSDQGHSTVPKHHHRKKNRMKIGHNSYSSSSNTKVQAPSSTVQFSTPLDTPSLMGDMSNSENKGLNKYEADKEHEAMQESISKAAKIALAQEACEKWRLRGNQAYANGNMSKAEDYYSRGINCISSIEMSRSCRALALCYSNRAATRMSLGRMREALGDCMMASAIDPEFLRVQVRAANCHLALGEVEDASLYFNKGLQSVSVVCLDRKIVIEASEGLQKAQKVAECMDCSAELLQKRTVNNADSALGIISEALSISPYSDRLLEMKAKALFMLRKYEEVIQLCEQTLDSAEKNFSSVSTDGLLAKLGDSELVKSFTVRFWRWRLISKSHFYLGRLEVALDLLEKLEHIESIMEKCGSKNAEPSVLLAVTVRELLRHKTSGNEAFQSGRYAEAIEHYTSALSCNSESRPFAAICFCNRAAASQALGQITDAIADCSIAIALDGNYLKAISRRATLHEMIRDYGQAANDLQRLISLLEKELEDKANQSGALGRSTSNLNDLRQARLRLSTIEDEARKEIPLNMYIILGVEPSGMASDIKKAYRKAALRHHPDKAGQFLARSENGDDGIWKEIAEEVHKDADRLFKMIGEAYTVLSEPTKRSRYDLEEEMRMAQKSSTPRTTADVYDHQFERTGNRRQWREGGKPYGNSYSRWSESSRSS